MVSSNKRVKSNAPRQAGPAQGPNESSGHVWAAPNVLILFTKEPLVFTDAKGLIAMARPPCCCCLLLGEAAAKENKNY